MQRNTLRLPVCTLVSGLLLAACGGSAVEQTPTESPLGTQQSALCTNLSVDSLIIAGASSYQGELASSGTWENSTGANGVRLEYYVDGVLRSSEERLGGSGTWFFSASGTACGWHEVEVRAFPMVVDSAGNRTTCYDYPNSSLASALEYCAPSSSFTCTRTSSYIIKCTGRAELGSGSYTPYWQRITNDPIEGPIASGWAAGTWIHNFGCEEASAANRDRPRASVQYQFKVQDSNGSWTSVSSTSYTCVLKDPL